MSSPPAHHAGCATNRMQGRASASDARFESGSCGRNDVVWPDMWSNIVTFFQIFILSNVLLILSSYLSYDFLGDLNQHFELFPAFYCITTQPLRRCIRKSQGFLLELCIFIKALCYGCRQQKTRIKLGLATCTRALPCLRLRARATFYNPTKLPPSHCVAAPLTPSRKA